MKYETGKHYKLITIDREFVIAKFDLNKEANDVGFNFTTRDGAGFLAVDNLAGIAKVIPIEFIEVDTEKKRDLFKLVENANNIVAYSFSCVNRDDTTFTSFNNDWKPAMLIGEMACASKMVIDHESEHYRKRLS